MGLWDSIKNIMTIPEDDDYDEEVAETAVKEEPKKEARKQAESPKLIKSKSGAAPKSVSPQLQVVLVKPDRFEDVTSIADNLNEKKTVVLNLEAANREVSRRIIDFLSGAAYANHGNIKKVANNTFIIVANGVDVLGELMLEDYEEGKLYF